MRIGHVYAVDEIHYIPDDISAGVEFVELIAPQDPTILPKPIPDLSIPLIWQLPATLPADHPNDYIRIAVTESWYQHLEVALQWDAKLMVVQLHRPQDMQGKTALFKTVDRYVAMLAPLTTQTRQQGIQLVLRNTFDNRDQLQLLREIFRQVAGLGFALDIGYAHHLVNKSLVQEFLWDSDIAPRLAHMYASDTDGKTPNLRLPLGSQPTIDWQRMVSLIRERYNASVTIDCPRLYQAMNRQLWRTWWESN